MTDLTGVSTPGSNGEPIDDLVAELGEEEVGTLTEGEQEAAAMKGGERAEEGSWTGIGGIGEVWAAGEDEGVVFSGFFSSGKNGCGKKRLPGVVTKFIWKGQREDQDLIL